MSGQDSLPSNQPGELVRLLRQRYEDEGDTISRKAADEIERLTAERDEWKRGSEVVNARLLAEVKRLQAALTDIAEPKGMDNESENALRRHIARRALEGQL